MTGRDPHTLTARWVFPVAGPPLPGGLVSVRNGRIVAVEPGGTRRADEDLGNVALVPGLVNAHTHLDLSGALRRLPPGDADHFPDWLRAVIAYRSQRSPAQVRADVHAGLAQCLRFGTTLLGDIATEGASWDALAVAPLRAVVYFELIGLSAERARQAKERWRLWDHGRADTATCRKGVSPHAPYSVARSLFEVAPAAGRPVTVHLAESPAELELIARRTGPFRDFLEALGLWHPEQLVDSLDRLVSHGRPDPPTVWAHGNYLPPDTPLPPSQSVAYCPRTHAAFGHAPHPFRELLRRGRRVCLATDSLASNPDLDVLAEARFVHARYPEFPGDRLLRMITLSGAEALGWAAECGSLEVGKSADLVAVPLPDRDAADPHELLFADHPGPRRTMFRGHWRTG